MDKATQRKVFGIIAIAVMINIALVVLKSCVSSQAPATRSTATVVQVDGDRVLVTFQVVDRDFSDQAANWFYIPRHSYQLRDRYPDPDKDPSLQKSANGNR